MPMAAMNAVFEPISSRETIAMAGAMTAITDFLEKSLSLRSTKLATAIGRVTVRTAVISFPE